MGPCSPLRQPRLSPLCGCECELIENVSFSTFLIADKKKVQSSEEGLGETDGTASEDS